MHSRLDMLREDRAHDRAEVDAEILDARAVRHGEIRHDAHQDLVQREPLRPENDELDGIEARQVGQLAHLVKLREDVVGPEDRRQMRERVRDPRLQPRIPRSERGGAGGVGIHETMRAFGASARLPGPPSHTPDR